MANARTTARPRSITPDDVMAAACAVLSIFIREPEFQGQTKEKLSTPDAQRLVENVVRDHFDHWLAESPADADKLLDFVIDQAEDRLKRRQEKETRANRPRASCACPASSPTARATRRAGTEIFLVEGDSRRRLGQAGARPRHARRCCPCAARSSTSPAPRAGKLAAEPGALRSGAGAGLRHGREIPRRGPALRARHHHDRRRCRRRAYRLAAADLLLSRDAAADRRTAISISPCRRSTGSRQGGKTDYARDDADRDRLAEKRSRPAPKSRSRASRAWAR